jgi:hypothetical protein
MHIRVAVQPADGELRVGRPARPAVPVDVGAYHPFVADARNAQPPAVPGDFERDHP